MDCLLTAWLPRSSGRTSNTQNTRHQWEDISTNKLLKFSVISIYFTISDDYIAGRSCSD